MKAIPFIALAAVTAALLAGQTGNRKGTQNQKSPPADTSITLGDGKVTIEYNAPSVRGREVGKSVDPYSGKVWRFGADSATTLTTEADIMIGDLKVPKGAHTLYILVDDSGWNLIVNNQTKQWGLTYNQDQDLGRTKMTTTPLSTPAETLKINLKKSGASAGTLEVEWGNTKATVPVKTA
jgi:hypothetical protein